MIGLYVLLIGYNNIVDYGSNFEFVRHVLLMDTTFPGNALRGRAIESADLHRYVYALIIAIELICGAVCLIGAFAWPRGSRQLQQTSTAPAGGLSPD